MGRQQSLRSKAAHLVSDLTTFLLNPVSDKPSKPASPPSSPPSGELNETKGDQLESAEEDSDSTADGPDTSSFTAFLYSLLSSAESGQISNSDKKDDNQAKISDPPSNTGKKGLLSRGRQSLSRTIYHAARITGYRNQERKGDSDMRSNDAKFAGVEMREKQRVEESVALRGLPDLSEPSLLLSENTRSAIYASLPALVQGKKWFLLYSTGRHGISLSTLYRRSMLLSGLSLLVVGDRKGAVFGGLVEAPLRPTSRRKYQGTNNTFVYTNIHGHPVIFRPTGVNHYFTLCSTDFLAIGGGGHFALYLDGDLLSGSSSVSETYANPCLAHTEDFQVKEVELWGFVYASKYEEILAASRTEAPGICRW